MQCIYSFEYRYTCHYVNVMRMILVINRNLYTDTNADINFDFNFNIYYKSNALAVIMVNVAKHRHYSATQSIVTWC